MKTYRSGILFVAAACFLFGTGALAQTETQELIFPQMAVGGDWESELTLVAQGAETSRGLIYFVDQNGNPMEVTVDGGASTMSLGYNLPSRSSRTWKLTGGATTRVGFILSYNDIDAVNRGSISGVLTYRFKPGGLLKSQIGVLPSRAVRKIHLPFDNTNGNKTGIALVALEAANVQFNWYNEAGVLQNSTTRNYASGQQRAFYIYELFPASDNTRGLITMDGSGDFNMMGINDNLGDYSSTAILPGVFERELTITISGNTNYRLRLVREGNFFYGLAETVSTPGWYLAQGTFLQFGLYYWSLQLTISGFVAENQPAVYILTAPAANETLTGISGRVVTVKEDGTLVSSGSGTFTLNASGSAQF